MFLILNSLLCKCKHYVLLSRLKLKYWLSRVTTWQEAFPMLSQHTKSTSLLSVSLLRATLLGTQNLLCTNQWWTTYVKVVMIRCKCVRKSKGTRTSSRICKSVPSFCTVYAVSKGGLSMVYSPGLEGDKCYELFQANESANSELHSDEKPSTSGKILTL